MSIRSATLGLFALASTALGAWAQAPALQLQGENTADGFGWSVAPAGDVNDDGIADVIVGAPSHASVAGFAGRAYLFHGPFTGLRLASQADAILSATTFGDNLGIAVAGAGDLNSDGFDDLVIGARGNDGAGIQAGRCYVFNGPLSGNIDDTQADAVISGVAFDEVGHEVHGGGDLNGDGIADIVLGAPLANVPFVSCGQAHVFYGPVSGNHSTSSANATISGLTFNEMLGSSIAVGDLNDDGQDDLIVGAPRPPLNGQGTGRVYVFFGPVSGAQSAASASFVIDGEAFNDEFGSSLSIGDVNNDSVDDLVVGASQFFTNLNGKAYLFLGPFGAGSLLAAQADALMMGEGSNDSFGTSVASGTDTDGDGFDDVLVGAPDFGGNFLNGRAYVFRGPISGLITAGSADQIFTGANGDQLGHCVATGAAGSGEALLLAAPAHPSFPSAGIVQIVEASNAGVAFCSGDGTGTACPCGNAGGAGRGCASSVSPTGGRVSSTGQASLASDTLALQGSGMPSSAALYFQGTTELAAGQGVVFGDGLRCVGGSIVRLSIQQNAGGISQYPEPGDAPIHVRGSVTSPGVTRTYQVWYRNAAPFCTPSTFNLTNGVRVTWAQ